MTRTQDIERYARALTTTTDSYLNGFMSRATWTSHMRSLWGTVDARGLRTEVMAQVDPLANTAQRSGQRGD